MEKIDGLNINDTQMTNLFLGQTVIACPSENGFVEYVHRWLKHQEDDKANIENAKLGVVIAIESDSNNQHSEMVYESLSESATNKLFRPNLNLTFKRNDSSYFPEVSKKITSGIFNDCSLGDTIKLAVYDQVMVLSWWLLVGEPVNCGIFSKTKQAVETELSNIGVALIDCLAAGFTLEFPVKSHVRNEAKKFPRAPLWTSRTLLLSESCITTKNTEWVENWIDEASNSDRVTNSNAVFSCGWGNNLVRFKNAISPIDDFVIVSSGMQYLYAALHLTNEFVTSFLAKIKSSDVSKKSKMDLKEAGNKFFFLEYTLLETEYSLQGFQRKILLSFLVAWRIKDLIKNINYKIQRIKSLVDEAIAEKYGKFQRRIRAMLFLIGTTEIIGAAVEVIHLSHSAEVAEAHTYGLLRVIHSVNPDLLITGLLIALFALAGFAIRSGIAEERGD